MFMKYHGKVNKHKKYRNVKKEKN